MAIPTPPGNANPRPDHHDHPDHHSDHPDCPDHYKRCFVNVSGFMDCPTEHVCYKTEMLTVACGADDPKPQIQAFLNAPGHLNATVAQVIDLGHNGWLIIFNVPA